MQVYAQTVIDVDEVVVSAGEDKVASEVPQAVSVVDQEELDNLQPASIGEALSSLPGVNITGSSSFLGQSFNIRGIGSGVASDEPKIIMLIDGQGKYYEQYRMGSLFVDTDLLKRVEVLRGPGSSTLYGSGAMGGVISMETKDASDFLVDGDTFAVRQKFSYHSNDNSASSTTIFALAPSSNTELLAAISVKKTDTTIDGNGDGIVVVNAVTPSFLLKGSRSFGDSKITASYQHLVSLGRKQDLNQLDGGWGIADRDVTDQTALLKYEHAPLDNPLVDLAATLSFTNSYVSARESDPEGLGTFDLPEADYGYKKFALQIENTSEFSGSNFEDYLTVGASASRTDRHGLTAEHDPIRYHPEGIEDRIAIYAQNEFVLNDRLTITTGLRYETQTIDPGASVVASQETISNSVFEPQIALLYKVNDSWNVFGSATRVNRLPSVDEIYDVGSRGPASLPALGTLDPEEGINLELGFSFAKSDLFSSGDALSFKTTAFRNDMDSLIALNPLRSPAAPQNANVRDALIQGLEFEGRYATENFYTALGLSIIDGEDSDGNPLASTPGNEFSLEIGANLPQRDFSFGLRSVFTNGVTVMRSDNLEKYNSYNIHNVFVSYKPDQGPLAGAELHLGVDNLFDTYYEPALYSAQRDGTRTAGRGRNFKISLAKTF